MTALDGPVTARPASDVLAACRAAVTPALRAAVDTLPGAVRRIAGYHFGWWDRNGEPAGTGTAGKALRPAVVLLAAEAVGGSPDASTVAGPAAAAVELVHAFSLLHDDVMDRDEVRHHRPTVWRAFGVNAAILAGDALLALAMDVLAASHHPSAGAALRMLAGAVQDLVDGQLADLEFEQRQDVTPAQCEAMGARKTGALVAGAAGIGALFGGAGPERVDRLRAFGCHLGIAFQHVDDLLGIWGDPAVTGKAVHSDLRSRKKTMPVVAALTSDTPPGRELAALYGGAPGVDLTKVAELVDRAGGRAYCREQADRHLDLALRELAAAGPAERPTAELRALARLAAHRDH